MKNSIQRNTILEIINNSYDHLDAYGIYNEAKKTIPNISLGTIYRNLKFLSQNNMIKNIKVNGVIHYDKNMYHHHFICNNCHKIVDIHNLKIPKISNIDGNIVSDYEIVLKGLCKNCQKEE